MDIYSFIFIYAFIILTNDVTTGTVNKCKNKSYEFQINPDSLLFIPDECSTKDNLTIMFRGEGGMSSPDSQPSTTNLDDSVTGRADA